MALNTQVADSFHVVVGVSNCSRWRCQEERSVHVAYLSWVPFSRSTVVVEGGAAFAELGLKTVEQDGDVQAIMGLWGGACTWPTKEWYVVGT